MKALRHSLTFRAAAGPVAALAFPFCLAFCTSGPGPGKEPGREPGKEPTGKEEPGRKEIGRKEEPKGAETPDVFQENQPEFPEPTDDPYFLTPAQNGVVFRVLITEGNYQVRQLGEKESIRRKKDAVGDRDQVRVFRRFSDRYNFDNTDFTGILSIRLNPHSGEIEMAKFLPGHTPPAWQATMFLKDDVSRMAFSFPRERVAVREFKVQYLWRIRRPAGLSDEDARRRLIEFLKQESEKR